jgi:hypothetical protein
MVVVAGPTSVYIDEIGNEGLTGTVTLATSHASIHIWDAYEVPMFQFDIYSCKKYDLQIVIDHLNEMELVDFDWMAIDRNEGLSVSDAGTGFGTRYISTPITKIWCILPILVFQFVKSCCVFHVLSCYSPPFSCCN